MIFCMNKKKLDKVDNASLENLISLNVSKNDFFFLFFGGGGLKWLVRL